MAGCDTCKHWDGHRQEYEPGWGFCQKVVASEQAIGTAYVYQAEPYAAALRTFRTFGCCLYVKALTPC